MSRRKTRVMTKRERKRSGTVSQVIRVPGPSASNLDPAPATPTKSETYRPRKARRPDVPTTFARLLAIQGGRKPVEPERQSAAQPGEA